MPYPRLLPHVWSDCEAMDVQDRFPVELANWMSVLLIIGSLLYSLVVLHAGQPGRLVVTIPLMLLGLAGLVLRGTQRPKILFATLIIGSWLCGLNALLWTKGISGAAPAVLILALSAAGWVMSLPLILLFTAATPFALFLFAYFEASGTLELYGWLASPYQRALAYSITAFGGATLGYFFGVSNRHRIGQLQQSERALRESLAELETRDEALRLSEAQIGDILDNSSTLVFVKDLKGRYLRINRRYEELFHVARDTVIGKTDYDIFSAEFAKAFREADRLALESGRPIEAEEWMPHDEGIHVYISVKFPLSGPDGTPYAVCSIATDITERKGAEQELRDWRERVRAAERITGLGTWYIELPSERVRWSEGQYELFGIDPRQFVPGWKSFIDLVHPEDRGAVKEAIHRLHQDHRPAQLEFRIVRPDGEVRRLHTSATLICDESGKPTELIGASLDITERKNSENALRASERQFRDLVATIPGMVYTFRIDPGGRRSMPFISGVTLERIGLSAAEIMEDVECAFRRIPGDALPEVEQSIAESWKNLSPWLHEFPIRTGEGGILWLRGNALPRREADGSVLWNGVFVDITAARLAESQRMRAEQAVRLQEERLRLAMEATQQGWFDLNIQSGEVTVSPEYARILGYEPSEFNTSLQRWIDDIHPEDCAAVLDAYRESLETGKSGQMEYRRLTNAGEWKWIRSIGKVVEFDADGKPSRMTGTHADISERKRSEELLRKSEARFQTVFHASPLAINISSVEDGRLIDVNPAFTRLFGYSAREARGRTTVELGIWVDPEQRDKFVQALKNHAAVHGYEALGRLKSGEVRNMALYTEMIEYEQERCILTITADMTDRRRMEEARLRSQKLESLGTLAGGIAHDFNNLLLVINGNAKLALEDLDPAHRARTSLAAITKAGARASDLVRRILTFSRTEAEKREVLSLRPVLEEVLTLLRPTLPATIEFRSHFGEDVPLVAADASQVHEALVNLANNAAQAIGASAGLIDFALEPVDIDGEHAAKVAGLRPGRYARLSVTDNGCGMDEAIVGRIFDAFFTTQPAGQGTGLGLSMVHGIMKGHGGAIEVRSSPGKGSTFRLYFPACEGQGGHETSERLQEVVPAAGRRILYVDDEQDLVYLMEQVLARLGHRVCAYADPQQALRELRLRPREFDVVVTDLSMPGISGFELAREVLSIRPDIPVVMTTGYIGPEDEQRARAAGIRELILKPNVLDDLGVTLDRLFREDK